jgi:hypothetical protein
MTLWICRTCGLEHADTPEPPATCAICSDDRQYLTADGQVWTTLEEIQRYHTAALRELDAGLYGITVTPKTGIGHRPILVVTAGGNVLWDPPAYIDDALVAEIRALGGIAAIASSHPHLTGVSITWSHTFGGIPVWVNADDERWIRRPDPVIQLWQDQQEVLPGVTLVQCGGHFAGSAVLVWAEGADGQGVALSGDTFMVVADKRWVTFQRSYPNDLPLSERSVRKIVAALEPFPFERAYSGFDGGVLAHDAHDRVRASAERYIGWLRDEIVDPDERR